MTFSILSLPISISFWGSSKLWHKSTYAPFQLNDIPYMHHHLFTHQLSLPIWVVPLFLVLWITLLQTFVCRFLCGHTFLFLYFHSSEWTHSLHFISGNGTDGSCDIDIFNFLLTTKAFLQYLHHFAFTWALCEGSYFSTSLLTVIFFLLESYSRCEVVPPGVFCLCFLNDQWFWASFTCFLAICIASL